MAKDREGFSGVWRTIRGAHVFIRDGEDLDSAIKRNEKFKKSLADIEKEYKEKRKQKVEERQNAFREMRSARDEYGELSEEFDKKQKEYFKQSDELAELDAQKRLDRHEVTRREMNTMSQEGMKVKSEQLENLKNAGKISNEELIRDEIKDFMNGGNEKESFINFRDRMKESYGVDEDIFNKRFQHAEDNLYYEKTGQLPTEERQKTYGREARAREIDSINNNLKEENGYNIKDNQITKIAPYDDTDYAWGRKNEKGTWDVIYKDNQNLIHKIEVSDKETALSNIKDLNSYINKNGDSVTSNEGTHRTYIPNDINEYAKSITEKSNDNQIAETAYKQSVGDKKEFLRKMRQDYGWDNEDAKAQYNRIERGSKEHYDLLVNGGMPKENAQAIVDIEKGNLKLEKDSYGSYYNKTPYDSKAYAKLLSKNYNADSEYEDKITPKYIQDIDAGRYGNMSDEEAIKNWIDGGADIIFQSDAEKLLNDWGIAIRDDNAFETYKDELAKQLAPIYRSDKKNISLSKMSLSELRSMAKDYGIETKGLSQKQLIAKLISMFNK